MDHVCEVLEVREAPSGAGPPQSVCDEVEAFPTAGDAGVDALSGRVQFVDPLRVAPISGDVDGEPPVFEEAATLDEGVVVGTGGMHELEEPLREGLLDVVEFGIQGAVGWLGVEGEGVDFVFGPSHGTFRHGGIGWRLPDESDANPTAPVGHAEIREPPVVVEEVARTRGWSLW